MRMPRQLNVLLKATSRSFYLTLRVLPAGVRPQISLAYLLARTTDTIADTELVPQAQRLHALQILCERILGVRDIPVNFGELARHQESSPERMLLEEVEKTIALLQLLSAGDLDLVRTVLRTITGGQELDLHRFSGASAERIVALPDNAALDDYVFRVAGCVGEFWTRLCRAHLFPAAKLDDALLIADGIRFGKGLQLVNILRDLPVDLRKGRCYLPVDRLAEIGLAPADLLLPSTESKVRPLYEQYLDLAAANLTSAWDYTNALPWRCARVRLACAWPILIGIETIGRLRTGRILDPGRRIKIDRRQIRSILLKSTMLYPLPGAWRRLFAAGTSTGKRVASGGKLA